MQQLLTTEHVYNIPAIHYFSERDIHPGQNLSEEHDLSSDDRDAGGMSAILRLSKGTRVMLLRNMKPKSGMVNGAMGTVDDISIDQTTNQIIRISVLFDNPDIGRVLN